MIGKTIKSIEYTRWGDTALIRFTDGSALQIRGHSYEEVDLSFTELSPEQFRRRAARQQGEREAARVRNLTAQARPRLPRTPFAEALHIELESVLEAYRRDMNNADYGAA